MNITYNLKPQSERRREAFVPTENLPFGMMRTDHMFLAEYEDGEWKNPRIVPYGALSIMPGAVTLHYAQEVFEGCKSFKHADGELYSFRIDKNAERLNASCGIMCMPSFPVADQVQAIQALIDVDRLWYPDGQDGASIYIRPFMFGSSDALGVKPSKKYTYCIFLSPSGPYYATGFKPQTLLVTSRFHRAAPGGSGAAKAGGNYAASMRAFEFAHKLGASQVLYLDASNTTIEEAGAMNHYHVTKDKKVVIPTFTDTILKSITSRTMLDYSDRFEGFDVVQETIKLQDFIVGVRDGSITEAGGFGTAAGVSPVGRYILEDGQEFIVNNQEIGDVTRTMYTTLTGIQRGTIPAPEGWLHKVEHLQ